MKTALLCTLVVLCLAAPSAADEVAPAPAAPAPAALGDTLRAGGSPVYFTAGDDGVHARSADGKLALQLAPGPAARATFDADLELLWFVSAGTLQVIDLRAPAGAPVTLATKVPDGVKIRVVIGKDPGAYAASSHAEIVVIAGKKPKLVAKVVEGDDWDWWYEGSDGEKMLKAQVKKAKKAKLTGGAWLKTQAARKPRKAAAAADQFSDANRVKLPENLAQCEEDPSICGLAAPFAAYKLVYVSHSCGDFCYQTCLIYDPAKDVYAVPPDTSTWAKADKVDGAGGCGNYRLDAAGKAFLTEDSLCVTGGACKEVPGVPLGWLDPGAMFLLPEINGPPG